MIDHTAKVMPILLSVLVLIGFFLTSCVGKPYMHSPPSSIVTIRLCVVEEIETEIMGIIGCRGFKLEPSVEPMVFFCSHFTIGTEFEMDGKTTRVGPTDSQTLQRGRRKDEGGRRELGGRQRIEERDLNFECLKCRDDSGGHSRKIKKVA